MWCDGLICNVCFIRIWQWQHGDSDDIGSLSLEVCIEVRGRITAYYIYDDVHDAMNTFVLSDSRRLCMTMDGGALFDQADQAPGPARRRYYRRRKGKE